jgi:glycine cleavage system regulatory protein
MNSSLVMTIIGDDHPGIVGCLSQIVASHGANWVDSQMAHLGGKFAGVLQIDCKDDSIEGLKAELCAIEGLDVSVERSTSAMVEVGDVVVLEIIGQDRPGIVRQISQAIASQGVNVEKLTTGCESAPMSGEILFKARAELRIPTSASIEALQMAIEHIASDLMVDAKFPNR